MLTAASVDTIGAFSALPNRGSGWLQKEIIKLITGIPARGWHVVSFYRICKISTLVDIHELAMIC